MERGGPFLEPPRPSAEASGSDFPCQCPLDGIALIHLLLGDPLVDTVGNSRCKRDDMLVANAFGNL